MPHTVVRPRALLLGLALVASSLPASAGAAAQGASASSTPLTPASAAAQARIARLLPIRVAQQPALGRYRAVVVSDVATGGTVWQSGSRVSMRGASTTKLATAVTALRLLGTTTRLPTRVVSGRWTGEVVLVAGGDPLLTSAQLSRLAHATALALLPALAPAPADSSSPTPAASPSPAPTPSPGATLAPRPIRVSVRVDDSLYPSPTPAVGWPSDYLPSVVAPVRPLVRDLRNVADTSRDAASWFTVRLDAELKALTSGRTDVALTARFMGRLAPPTGSHEIARFAGNTSGAAIARMLLVSDNDVAEMLARDSALAAGRPATWAGALATVTSQLRGLGVDTTGWRLHDGSGLSRADRVTARGLVQILRVAQQPQHPELAPLRGMLPVAGVSGTLRVGRFATRPTVCARGEVAAKTGSLYDTTALAGYVLGSDGRLRAFAVLVHTPSRHVAASAVRTAVDVVPATATGCY